MMKTEVKGRVLELTMQRPPVNAINAAWIDAFNGVLDGLVGKDIAVLHIRSDQKTFCAGFDLAYMSETMNTPGGGDQMIAQVRRLQALFFRIEALPQISVAEIGGAALGGGFELALSCDFRFAGDEVRVGLPEMNLGLLPGAGGTQRLPRLLGANTAAKIILAAETPTGKEAQALGMVHYSAPKAELPAACAAFAQKLGGFVPAALAQAKRCIAMSAVPGDHGFEEELAATRRLQDHPESRARVSAFLEKSAKK